MYLKPGSRGIDKLDCRWEFGIWLGSRDESCESIVGAPSGCIKVNDIRRLGSNQERWCRESFDGLKGTPWEPVPGSGTTRLKVNVQMAKLGEGMAESPQAAPRDYVPKRFRITRMDFAEIGYTPLCPGCRALIRNLPHQSHSEVCRSRVEAHLREKRGPQNSRGSGQARST